MEVIIQLTLLIYESVRIIRLSPLIPHKIKLIIQVNSIILQQE